MYWKAQIKNCQPEEKELVETIVWIVLSWSLLRTTTESLKFDVMKIRMMLIDYNIDDGDTVDEYLQFV